MNFIDKAYWSEKTERLEVRQHFAKSPLGCPGLSQIELATKVVRPRNYALKRLKSDIQLETLNKIVQLGIGRADTVQNCLNNF